MVRTWKANKLARDTHWLERAEVGIGENMEASKLARDTHILERAEVRTCLKTTTKQASERHSQPRDCRV